MVFSSFARTVFLCLTQVFRFVWQINSKWISHSKIYCCRTIEESDEKKRHYLSMYLLLFFSRWFRCLTFSFSLFFFQFFSLFKLALFVFAELDVCLCVGPSFTRSLCACISIHICVELVGRNEAKTNNNCTNKLYNNTHGFFYRALTRDKQNESHDTNVKS